MPFSSDEYVQFPVPKERVPDVARFLYGNTEAMPKAGEVEAEPEVSISEEQRGDLLTRIYVESEPTFRRLLLLVADRDDPELAMPYTEVTTAMRWTSARSLPGALGAFGRRTNHRYGGYWPLRCEERGEGWVMWMDGDVAAFLIELHAQRQLPTQ
jgi:hypothetical protein